MKMNVTDTVKQACGHWPRILPALGMKVIKNRHQACPVCGGADRFRFDDKEGRGTWFCNQCGAGRSRNFLYISIPPLHIPPVQRRHIFITHTINVVQIGIYYKGEMWLCQ